MGDQIIGRYSDINNVKEISKLEYGMDFRDPIYRREVFLRFYEFHLANNSHPGAVYFAFPELAKLYNQTMEQKLWMAFINGCSQNIVTTDIIYEKFPSVKDLDINKLDEWWNVNHIHFKAGSGWDSDRKYFKIGKTGFPQCVASYKAQVDKYGSQQKMFEAQFCSSNDKFQNFRNVWDFVRDNFLSFGRLSTFSYLEYLRIQGLNLDCDSLFLKDISGSKSHRNGLCKVLGRDDLDWWDAKESHNPNFTGYTQETLEWLELEGAKLLNEASKRIDHVDVSYFTLESTLCCYKSWYRPNRRYPNVYMDMFYNRIKYAESEWPERNFEHFWKMRKDRLPESLRLEVMSNDPGLSKEKQNHFRLTGQPIMMDGFWSEFKNDFNDNVNSGNLERFFL
jgi:hypothetical protein